MMSSDLRRFVLLLFLLLLPAFALWTTLSDWLAGPALWLSNLILTSWLPDVVHSLSLHDHQVLLLTQFAENNGVLSQAAAGDHRIGFEVNTRLVSYSLPFYAALHFATPQVESVVRFSQGVIVLFILMVIGLVSICLKDLMVGLGPTFFQTDAWLPPANAIALLYQFSVLIVPPVSPVLLWAFQVRDNETIAGLLRPR